MLSPKMLLRLKLDPARMQLLMGFFDTYLVLSKEEESEVKQALKDELPPGELKEMAEILTAYHKMGIKEGVKEGIKEGLDIFFRICYEWNNGHHVKADAGIGFSEGFQYLEPLRTICRPRF